MQRASLNAEMSLAALNVRKREAFQDEEINELTLKIKTIEAEKTKVEDGYR